MSPVRVRPWERRGLDLLLSYYPTATVIRLDNQEGPFIRGQWIEVDLSVNEEKKEFGIWKETGAVYKIDQHGAAADDPFLIPEGSPYHR